MLVLAEINVRGLVSNMADGGIIFRGLRKEYSVHWLLVNIVQHSVDKFRTT